MANPSYWVFRRGAKWHSGWRDENGRCHSKVHPIGAGKAARPRVRPKMAIETCQVRGPAYCRKYTPVHVVFDAFLSRENVKTRTYELNRRHLEACILHFKLESVEQLTEEVVNDWLRHLKSVCSRQACTGVSAAHYGCEVSTQRRQRFGSAM